MPALQKQQPPAKMTFDEFMAWNEHQEGRWELHDGVPVRRHDPARGQSERLRHLDVKAGVFMALHQAVRAAGRQCHVVPDGATVKISDTESYEPDALLYCGDKHDGNNTGVPNPLIVVEVLSPGTRGKDLGDKLQDYFTLPSVAHYLIIDPERRIVSHYRRHEEEGLLLHICHEGSLHLEPPDITIAVADIFASLT